MSTHERTEGAAGVDAGASLIKLALPGSGAPPHGSPGESRYELVPSGDVDEAERRLLASGASHVGLTGAGAADLAERLEARARGGDGGPTPARVNEFAAWGAGASALLGAQGLASSDPYLLVSLGTGTSVMLADGLGVTRIGGTALGGGTVVGLGRAMLGVSDFGEIAALAARGDRRKVDLLVGDIYRPGEIGLLGDTTAASFGKLGRNAVAPAREDLAQAVMGLVGENVSLICAGFASARQVGRAVFGGSTLRDNPSLRLVLELITRAYGLEVVFLDGGEFAGAVGAARLAAP